MIGEDDELMAEQILAPLVDGGSDSMKLAHVCRSVLHARTEWFAKECDRVTLLLKKNTHGGA